MNQKYKQKIIDIIKKHIPHCKIYLFGSRARSTHSAGADIDLAIQTDIQINRHTLCTIKEEIEDANIPFFVDIIDMKSASKEIKSQIDKDKKLWSN